MKIPFFKKLNTWHYINKCFRFDKRRYVRYSRAMRTKGTDHLLPQIALITHVIEKGLTMPEMRHGFGQAKIHELIMLCHIWSESFDRTDPFYVQAVKTILEYGLLHQKIGYAFDEPFRSELESFMNDNRDMNASEQPVFEGANEYFSNNEKAFPFFARSRHSIRNFSRKDIPMESIMNAIELAQCAPSSCNRQSTRVHVISNKTSIRDILSIQNGNRGFGHLTNKLLIITYQTTNYFSVKERNLGYIDSGIFAMNLLYALHYYKIGACTLNWCDSPDDDARLRSIVRIDDKETVSLLIACGMVQENSFYVAKSQRVKVENITTIHQ